MVMLFMSNLYPPGGKLFMSNLYPPDGQVAHDPGVEPQWGTADAEIKNPPDGSQGLSKVPSF